MRTTPDLIERLAADVRPVSRLRPPAVRALLWIGLAILVTGLLALSHGVRPDLGLRLEQPLFLAHIVASSLTGILAAVAAFIVSVPGRSPWWLLLPAPALSCWLSTLGVQCLTDWVSIGPNGISLGETANCFATLALTVLPLWVVLLIMLRHAALTGTGPVAVAGSLAVSSIAATALLVMHPLDASAMILMMTLGMSAVLMIFGTMFRERMFSWVAPR